jgi:hypothetical protein
MKLKISDIVALLKAIPEKHLAKGAIGTIVHIYNEDDYEVEFANSKGEAYALLTLPAENLLLLKHEPEMMV